MSLHLSLPFHLLQRPYLSFPLSQYHTSPRRSLQTFRCRHRLPSLSVGKEDTEMLVSTAEDQPQDVSPEDQEYIRQIKRTLELLKKNRDMTIGEVRLIIGIEDLRETERKRLQGLEDIDEVTRDELVVALDEVHEGQIPENRVALRMLAEEMIRWPDLEVEPINRSKRNKSPYAKATDTGVDPKEAAKRLNVDWDSAVNVELEDEDDDLGVPSVVGYGALYFVTALPVIIGVSVVLILFYNSLQ